MKTVEELRAARTKLELESQRAANRRGATQSYKLGLYMAIETLTWAIGDGESSEHPYQSVLEA